jgi:capsular exopolysaccharide synthesis family protein
MRLPNDVGVTMAVTGQVSVDECIRKSEIENLSVLTSGPIPPNPAEMLHSDRFGELVKQLLERFDRVVFDSPPLLPVTDAAILARVVDGVVVVARGFSTQRRATAQALRILLDVKAHVVGVVINAVDLSRRDYKDYYYYYRRDGYYTRDPGETNILKSPPPPDQGASAH